MKRSVTLLLLAVLAVTSCGTAAQFAAERSYYDGIYYKPAKVRKVRLKSDEEFVELAAANLKSKSMDTTVVVVAPKDKVNVFIGWDFGWSLGWNWGFGPRFGWHGSWGWDPWYYSWNHWYSPWYYSPWHYDPWYYDPWYGPWDPWYRPWYRPYVPVPGLYYPTEPHGPNPRPLTVGGVGNARSGGMGTVTRSRSYPSGSGSGSNINPINRTTGSGTTVYRVTPNHSGSSSSGTINRGGGSSRVYNGGSSRSTSSYSSPSGSSSSPSNSRGSSGGGSYSGGSYSGGSSGGGSHGGGGGGSRGGGMGGGGRR